jgi:hypothetical protein
MLANRICRDSDSSDSADNGIRCPEYVHGRVRSREPDLAYWFRDRGIRSPRALITLDNAVENLSRRFQTGGSFLMPARFGLKIQPRGRLLANEEVDVHELLRF